MKDTTILKAIIKEIGLPVLYAKGNLLITIEYDRPIVFKVYDKAMVMEYTWHKWVGIGIFSQDGYEEQIAIKRFFFNENTTIRGLFKDVLTAIKDDANPIDAGMVKGFDY